MVATKKAAKTTKKQDTQTINVDDVLVTEEGLQQLKDELEHLETVKRREVADRLQEAISYGDLSENSEYQEAKEEQAFTEGRIIEVTKKIKHAKVISDQHGNRVNIGSTVDLKSEEGKETFTIVGSTEVDPFVGKISNESPLGKALLGAKKGDKVKVTSPGGKYEYEVLKIS
jgi:transcription elongation factor GreA